MTPLAAARWCMANPSREQLLGLLRESPQSQSSSRRDMSVQLRLSWCACESAGELQAAHEMHTNWHLARRGSGEVGEWTMYRCKTYPEPSSRRPLRRVASIMTGKLAAVSQDHPIPAQFDVSPWADIAAIDQSP